MTEHRSRDSGPMIPVCIHCGCMACVCRHEETELVRAAREVVEAWLPVKDMGHHRPLAEALDRLEQITRPLRRARGVT